MPGPDGSGGPHAFVDHLASPTLSADDHHHLERSLRLRPGDPLTVSDGNGSWRSCRFGASLTIEGDIIEVDEPAPTLTVGFAVTKGSKPELVVQKLTELGIDHIRPFVAERSIARWDDDKAAKQLLRFARIVREAAMQSRRVRLPVVHPLEGLADLAESGAVRADRLGEPLGPEHTTVLIGPEGGWTAEERQLLPAVHLAPNVLRAETAAIAAGTLMVHFRSIA